MSDKVYRIVPYNFDALEPYVIVGRREMLVEVVPDYEAAEKLLVDIHFGTPHSVQEVLAAALEGSNDEPV